MAITHKHTAIPDEIIESAFWNDEHNIVLTQLTISGIRTEGTNVVAVVGGAGIVSATKGQEISFKAGAGYAPVSGSGAGGGSSDYSGGAGGKSTIISYIAGTLFGGSGGSSSFGSGKGGEIGTSVTNQKVKGGGAGNSFFNGGAGGASISEGTGGEATGGYGGGSYFRGGYGGYGQGKAKSTGGDGGVTWLEAGGGGDASVSQIMIGGIGGFAYLFGGSGGGLESIAGVLTASVDGSGSDYEVDDELTLIGGDEDAQIKITEVDEDGGVVAFEIISHGNNYSTEVVSTSGGSGEDCYIEILSLTSGTGGEGGSVEISPGRGGYGDVPGIAGNINFNDADGNPMLTVYGDGTSVDVNAKLNALGGVDPDYVLYNKLTKEQFLKRLVYEVPENKLNGLAVWWNGSKLYGFSSQDGKTGKLYEIPIKEIETLTLPEISKTTKESFYFDAMTGEVKSSIRNVPERYTLKEGCKLDSSTGKFYKETITENLDKQGQPIIEVEEIAKKEAISVL